MWKFYSPYTTIWTVCLPVDTFQIFTCLAQLLWVKHSRLWDQLITINLVRLVPKFIVLSGKCQRIIRKWFGNYWSVKKTKNKNLNTLATLSTSPLSICMLSLSKHSVSASVCSLHSFGIEYKIFQVENPFRKVSYWLR